MSSVILNLWKNVPGKFFCLPTKSPSGKWKDNFFSRDEFGDIKAFIRDHKDHDIYFCPHGFNRRVRSSDEAVIPNLLWADLDASDPRNRDVFKGVKPTIALESSPGRFVGLWVLDKPMTTDLNRRMTYHVEADKGGWGLTKVLRVPGTRNFKYSTQPVVRTLWDDGPEYTHKKLNKWLPEDNQGDGDGEDLDAAEVFAAYQAKLPKWVRRELIATTIKGHADRSEMLWKLENECLEAGMSMDEAFAVIKRSVWNKFAGRRNEEEILRRELSKAVELKFKGHKPKGKAKRHLKSDEEVQEGEPPRFNFTALKDIEREEIDWLYYPYLARREITIVEGDPGFGKSYFVQMIAGKIAKGERIPNFYRGKPRVQGTVVYFDIENTASTVTKPRLEDNGFVDLDNYYAVEEPFTIDDEEALDEIYQHLERLQPSLVVFDTLNTYIGRADTHKASETAQAMGTFKAIAKDFNCSVVVIRHLTKGGGSVHYRGQGSASFTGSARIVIIVGADPEDTDSRAMMIHKTNLGTYPPAMTFRIEGEEDGTSRFHWGDFRTDLSAQQIADAAHEATKGKKGNHMQEAMEYLETTFGKKDKEIEKDRVLRMAEKRSLDPVLIERAAKKMRVVEKKRKGVIYWKIVLNNKADDEEDD